MALNEPVLADDYPVYGSYLYVVDGVVQQSSVFGTVRHLKAATGGKEVRRCDVIGRQQASVQRPPGDDDG